MHIVKSSIPISSMLDSTKTVWGFGFPGFLEALEFGFIGSMVQFRAAGCNVGTSIMSRIELRGV